MAFQASEYSAIDPALVSQLVSAGTTVATSAINASGNKKGAAKRRHKAKLEEIAALEPDHSPMWPIAAGLGVLAVVGYMLLKK